MWYIKYISYNDYLTTISKSDREKSSEKIIIEIKVWKKNTKLVNKRHWIIEILDNKKLDNQNSTIYILIFKNLYNSFYFFYLTFII